MIFYDNRLLDFEPPPEEVIVSDQKRLVVDTYTRYRITDPLLFYQTVSYRGCGARPAQRDGQRQPAAGARAMSRLSALLSHQRSAIMTQIRDEVSAQGKSFGINVIDVRIRRADLPEENSQAIFARMQSEREQQAAQYRGEGAEAAQTVRANAERERTVILAEAQRDAQKVRGDGDAESIRIYADAFGQDKEFFAFYRSMQAYRDALNGRTTSFVLTPDSGFFRFFENRRGGDGAAGADAAPAVEEPAVRSDGPDASAPSRAMRDLWTALALVLVIEGALYALFPEGMKRAAARALVDPAANPAAGRARCGLRRGCPRLAGAPLAKPGRAIRCCDDCGWLARRFSRNLRSILTGFELIGREDNPSAFTTRS